MRKKNNEDKARELENEKETHRIFMMISIIIINTSILKRIKND